MKKIKTLFASVLLFCSCFATSCADSSFLKFNDFTLEEDIYFKKVNNDVDTFSFINEIECSSNIKWKIFSDFECKKEIINKTIRLEIGSNFVYLLAEKGNSTYGFYNVNIYRRHIYSVMFNTDGGSYIPEQYIQEDLLVAKVDDPEKKGYTFQNWDYDFNEPVKSNLIINALWSPNFYMITFNTNGGSIESNSLRVEFGSFVTLPVPILTGYTFLGWFLDDICIHNGIWDIDYDVELFAKWEITHFTILYNLSGGTNSNLNPATYTIEDEILFYDPYRDGYTFKGWKLNNKIINGIEKGTTGNLEIIALWESITYTIQLDPNGGDLNEKILYVLFDSNYILPEPTRYGYKFLGWYSNNYLVSSSGVWKWTNIDVLTAKWEIEYYSITYNLNGGTNSDNNPLSYTIFDEFNFIDPVKDYYNFIGWYDDELFGGNKITGVKLNSTGNLELFAKWEICEKYKGFESFEFYDDDTDIVVCGYNDLSAESIIIPDKTTKIQNGAFKDCTKIKYLKSPFFGNTKSEYGFLSWLFGDIYGGNNEFYVPESLETIESSTKCGYLRKKCFYKCKNIKNFILNEGLVSIGESCFELCSKIEFISIPQSVLSINVKAFMSCESLQSVEINSTNVKTIETDTFNNCTNLSTIYLPSSITSIKANSFYNCISLANIYFAGTIAKWKQITKYNNWNYNVPAKSVICSDGNVDL